VQEVPRGIEVKPTLVEAQSPAVKMHARRSMSETATPNNAREFEACRRSVSDKLTNALFGERPPMKGFKETNGRPKHTNVQQS